MMMFEWKLLAVWTAALLPLIAEWGRGFWLLDLFNHFRIQTGILCAVLSGALAAGGRPAEGAAAAVSAAFCAKSVLDRRRAAGPPPPAEPDPERPVSILTCNVWFVSRNFQPLIRLIHREAPDIVVLLETTGPWFSEMREALSAYHHHRSEPRDDGFGLSVFSKLPIEAELIRLHPKSKPSFRCRVRSAGGDWTLWCMHPEPPFSPWGEASHRAELEALASRLAREPLPVVVTGDLNTAPWGRTFRRTLSPLKDAAAGKGLATTWPAPLPRILRIPIDHLLHTEHFRTIDYRVLPGVGSDHRPIYARLTRTH